VDNDCGDVFELVKEKRSEQQWKQTGALRLILKDKWVQAIYGPKADVLKSDIQNRLGA